MCLKHCPLSSNQHPVNYSKLLMELAFILRFVDFQSVSCVWFFCNPMDCSPPVLGLPRQEDKSGLPFRTTRDPPNLGTEPTSPLPLSHRDNLSSSQPAEWSPTSCSCLLFVGILHPDFVWVLCVYTTGSSSCLVASVARSRPDQPLLRLALFFPLSSSFSSLFHDLPKELWH